MTEYKSRAIALTYFKHKETSIISKMFTENLGLQTFIIKGARSKKSKKKIAFFQPLEISVINASFSKKKTLQNIKEINLPDDDFNIFLSINNKFLSLFIAEVLSKTLRENEKDTNLFEFIWTTRKLLSKKEVVSKNFSIIFLLRLAGFLGFYPSAQKITPPYYFDLKNAEFSKKETSTTINYDLSKYLYLLIKKQNPVIPYETRKELLDVLIKYYHAHHHELKNLTSHLVIESLRL